MDAFSKTARGLMIEVLQKMRDFQIAAFMIDPDTWRKGDLNSVLVAVAFEHAVTILPLLRRPVKTIEDIKTINELGKWISEQLSDTPRNGYDPNASPAFDKPEQLEALIKAWCRSWVQEVKATLILGDGVMSKVGALEAQRPTG